MPDRNVIRIDALRRLFRAIGEDEGILSELFDSFVEDTEPLFASMRAGAGLGDWPAVRRAAHTAKGAARDFGADDMAEICAGLERDAEAGAVADALDRIAAAETAFAAAKSALRRLLDSHELN